MTITKEQAEDMLKAATPLIEWMKNNCHPHCVAVVDLESIHLTEGIASRYVKEDRARLYR